MCFGFVSPKYRALSSWIDRGRKHWIARAQRPLGRRWTRLCAHLCLSCLLSGLVSGCGIIKMAYEDGETFTLLWASRYVSLDRDQEALARARLTTWLHWHRTTQLPDYAKLAQELQLRLKAPLAPGDMEQIETQMRGRWHTMVERALPDLADLALALRAEQLTRIEKKFASNDETYQGEFVDVTSPRRKKDLFNKELDRVEYWYGSLSTEQKNRLRDATDALPIDPPLWLAERQAREKEFLALLHQIIEQKPARDVVIGLLRSYATRLETSPDPVRRAYIEALNRANRDLYLTIANMTTPEQRSHAAEKLGDWIDDFNSLAQS